MPAGRSPAPSGRRRGRKKGAPTPSPPPLPHELNPLPPGTEVEVRIDDEGFYGSWYEATVVGFEPAAGRWIPAQYTVSYSHLVAQDGSDSVAASLVRPRPPPPPGPGSSSAPAPPSRFLLHDIVEAFDCNGWWSGIVVAPAPAPADPASPVTVAFPITQEVIPFPPNVLRHRRDFVGGEWVPSRDVVAVRPKGGARVYKAGEKVELLRERAVYGDSWFPATVAKAVDKLSYIVEYPDDQAGVGKVAVHRHWGYIRPAEYHRPRESKVLLCPGTAVEVYCDGAWSQGVVHRVVQEGCEYEVSVDGEEVEQLLTKAVYQVRPLYMWNGKHWTIPSDKRRANLRQQSASGKHPSSPVDATSGDHEHSSDPESSTAKKSRKEPQQQELMLDEGSHHASVSETDASLGALIKSLTIEHCPNSCLPLYEKNSLSVLPPKLVSISSMSENELLCASTGQTAAPVARNHLLDSCPPLSEKNSLSDLAHKIVSICSMSKNGILCASSGNSEPPEVSVPDVIGETEFSQDAQSLPSDGQLNTLFCGRNVDEACDMLSIPEVREQNIVSSLRNQQIQERPLFVKALGVKKCITYKRGKTHPKSYQEKNDASDHVQTQLKENKNSSGEEIICASSASPECQKTSPWTRQVSGGTSSGSDTEGVNFKKLARKEGTDLLDKDLAATISRVCQANRNAYECTDTAPTQVTQGSPLTNIPILSLDHLVQQDGSQVDEGSITLPLQSAESSELATDNISLRRCSFSWSSIPSHLAFSQISGYQIPFVKHSPAWPIIEAMDAFKKVPQQPHFRPLRQFMHGLREGMALGLMVSFANSVEVISKSSMADSIASFKEKIATLRHLEENGFNVEFLLHRLNRLLKIKHEHIGYLTEKDQLKAQLLEKTTLLSQIDERLDKKEQTIAKLEEELGRARHEAQMIAKEKECGGEELARLNAADSSADKACAGAELQFQSILAELHHKSLT